MRASGRLEANIFPSEEKVNRLGARATWLAMLAGRNSRIFRSVAASQSWTKSGSKRLAVARSLLSGERAKLPAPNGWATNIRCCFPVRRDIRVPVLLLLESSPPSKKEPGPCGIFPGVFHLLIKQRTKFLPCLCHTGTSSAHGRSLDFLGSA